ncbi:contact-dependent growth inhibition system immunity protein [Moraxella nasovis]|uniref:contact-dependent growth inhibition system immunity protein n=1 Tax=Moraxella nasovis TaxID=2904121 RepID=UPI0035CD0FCF
MMLCDVYLFDGMINIYPNRHVGFDAWEGLDDDKTVTLPLDGISHEVGKSLRLVLNSCL